MADMMKKHDLRGLRKGFQTLRHVSERLEQHLQRAHHEELSRIKGRCRHEYQQLCAAAADYVTSGQYRNCQVTLRTLSGYLREVVPLVFVHQVDVQNTYTQMHAIFLACAEGKVRELDEHCKALDFGKVRQGVEDLRSFAELLTGSFAVYVKDLEEIVGTDQNVGNMMNTLREVLESPKLWELGIALATLELLATTSDLGPVEKQKRKLSLLYHPDKYDGPASIQRRINDAADHLKSLGRPSDSEEKQELDLRSYHSLVQDLYASKVRVIPECQSREIERLLSQNLYAEVKWRMDAMRSINLVTPLVSNPPMCLEEILDKLRGKVQNHASQLGMAVREYCNKEKYSDLQRDLQALQNLISSFSIGYDAIFQDSTQIYEEVTRTVKQRIGQHVESSWRTQRLPKDAGQLKRFARNLTDLGQIWSELLEFREEVRKHIDDLLCNCLEDPRKGPLYLHKLGAVLSKGEVHEGEDAAAAATAASIGQHIINEFAQFKDVQVILWNQLVKKTQTNPDECIRQMQTKDMVQARTVAMTAHDLLGGLKLYKQKYDNCLQKWIDEELTVDDLVSTALREAKDLRNQHEQGGKLDLLRARGSLPGLLASIFAHYTITISGDSYMKLKEASRHETTADEQGGLAEPGQALVTPHNVQILAVLRMVGYGKAAEEGPGLNHLLQVRTGEGKSLILGAAATLFALLGLRVRCVCYSEYLSQRDWKAFHRTFSDFGVTELVKYSKITEYSEEMAARRGSIRELTLRMLGALPKISGSSTVHARAPPGAGQGRHHAHSEAANQSSSKPPNKISYDVFSPPRRSVQHPSGSTDVLLIDEVDVLFGQDFYGRTHDQFVKVQDEHASAILQDLWRAGGASAQQLLGVVKQSDHYKRLLQKYHNFREMVESQVAMMCSDLVAYKQGTPPLPVLQGGKVGYKVMDGIDYELVDGYKTAFAHLSFRQRLADEDRVLKEALSLLVPCGQFSYANIHPTYMFGVSGTVDELDSFQREAIAKYGIGSYTVLPSVYGINSTKFLEESNAIEIVARSSFFLHIARAMEDKVQVGDHQRAVLVFFRDAEILDRFLASPEAGRLRANVLRETVNDSLKEHYIRKAATVGQVTLATAIFGRGCDFACFDEQLHQHGGLHVLQTFVSQELSEEVQIKGRTARQGKRGTFSMILDAEALMSELQLSPAVSQNGQEACYQAIDDARKRKHMGHFESMKKALAEASRKDQTTNLYFDALLGADWKMAEQYFKDVHKNAMVNGQTQGSASVHFVICLDMSGSMLGNTWDYAKSGALSFLKSALQLDMQQRSRFSLVRFNDEACVDVEKSMLTQADRIFQAASCDCGNTAFGPPLAEAIRLIQKSSSEFDHMVILLYTDGIATFPQQETSMLQRLMAATGGKVDFFAICEETNPTTLRQVCKCLYPHAAESEHCMSAVKPEQICGKMEEVLERMNIGFVRDVAAAQG